MAQSLTMIKGKCKDARRTPLSPAVMKAHAASSLKGSRSFPRVAMCRPILYEAGVSLDSSHLLGREYGAGILVNISNGGLCFKTKRRLHKKTVIKVNVPVHQVSPAIPTFGQVVWVGRDLRSKGYSVGMRFIL